MAPKYANRRGSIIPGSCDADVTAPPRLDRSIKCTLALLYKLVYIVERKLIIWIGIYVLHAVQKKSRRTSKADLEVGAKRYREVIASRHS